MLKGKNTQNNMQIFFAILQYNVVLALEKI